MSPARLPDAGAPDALYLVDLSGYVFRAYHALPPLSNSRGEPTHAVLGTVNMLQKIVGERRPHMLAVAMDSKGPTFRHEVDARYKSTRPAPPPDLSQQMARVEQIVHAWDVACFRKDGLEADDLIAAVTGRALAEGWRVVIVSADKDLMQLVRDDDERVVLWDSMRDRVYGPVEVRDKLGVPPSLVRDFLALTGDTSDNVPGVPGVGPKTASDLLIRFGSFDALFGALGDVAKPKLRESLREHEADARVSKRLVTLEADVAVDWDKGKILWGGADVEVLRGLYRELEFHRQLDQIDTLAAARRESPRASPMTRVVAAERVYDSVLDVDALDGILAEARLRGAIGIAVEAASSASTRAEIVGVSLATEPGRGHYVPLRHRYLGCPVQLRWDQVGARLASLLADPGITTVGHDLKRSMTLLERAGVTLVGPAFDTLIGAYLLDPEAPNGLDDLARRELGVNLARPRRGLGRKRGARSSTFEELDVERAASFAAADAELALEPSVRDSSRASPPRDSRADARRRDAARASPVRDGDARRPGGRAHARGGRPHGRAADAGARSRVQDASRAATSRSGRAISWRRSSSTS
jgi:DNA polymerase-1